MSKILPGDIIYSVLSNIALPFAIPYVVLKTSSGKDLKKNLFSRLGFIPDLGKAKVWIHSSSAGETKIALELLKGIEKKGIGPILVTTMTWAGQTIIRNSGLKEICGFLPLDADIILHPLFKNARNIKTLILVEGEIWPNLIRYAKSNGKHVVVVNARMTESSFRAYKRITKLLNPFVRIDLVLARTKKDEALFITLGSKKVVTVGNIKLDIPPSPKRASREELGIPDGCPVVVIGSMREGEEPLFAKLIESVRKKHRNAFFVVAPRHPKRMNGRPFEPLNPTYRSKKTQKIPGFLLMLDSFGELSRFYSLADVAVVGGSFAPHGGHNIVEPISQGIPTIFGPNMDNFAEEASLFSNGKGGLMARDTDEAARMVTELLEKKDLREKISSKGLEELQKHRGSLKRTLEILERCGYI